MIVPVPSAVPPQYLAHVREMLASGERKLLGLVGPPGAGKSTLALALQAAFADVSQVVPLDGFHLANVELRRLGREARRGAPDTFDAAGYVALLRRLRRQNPGEVIYAPEVRREVEEAVAGAIPVHPQVQLVITEGNYLLLDVAPWTEVAALLDDIWYVDVDDGLRGQRLLMRHEHFGRTRQAAIDWVATTDEPNAKRIATTKHRARLVFQWN